MSAAPNDPTVTVSSVEPTRVLVARSSADGFGPEFIAPVVGPLFDRLADDLRASGMAPGLPAIAWYVELDDGSGRVEVNAAFTAPDGVEPGSVDGRPFAVLDLPGITQAAVISHVGGPDTIGDAWMALSDWMDREGWEPAGPCREVYLSPNDVPTQEWVTELHFPVTRA
jgi:hypothetical protein